MMRVSVRIPYLAGALLGTLAVAGLVNENTPIPSPGEAGAPHRTLTSTEAAAFIRGRLLFDKDFLSSDGVGPVFNGDSCRSCHQDPVIAGAGGIDVQVQRPAIPDGGGGFYSPPETGDLAQTHSAPGFAREEIPNTIQFVEERNSPTILGLGLVEGISDAAILAGEDLIDSDGDEIFGYAHILPDSSIGRFGWKAQVPDLESFIRDAMGNELGITVPNNGNPFGFTGDLDTIGDPELPDQDLADITLFLQLLDFPPKLPETQQIRDGEALFTSVGCAKCHTPVLDGVELYSNLLVHLVHDVTPPTPSFVGVTQGNAPSGFYRTPPLRGLRNTAPYFHDGRSETVHDAIVRHDGEARLVRLEYQNALDQTERDAILAFLNSR